MSLAARQKRTLLREKKQQHARNSPEKTGGGGKPGTIKTQPTLKIRKKTVNRHLPKRIYPNKTEPESTKKENPPGFSSPTVVGVCFAIFFSMYFCSRGVEMDLCRAEYIFRLGTVRLNISSAKYSCSNSDINHWREVLPKI